MFKNTYSLLKSKWQLLALFIGPALLLFIGHHPRLEEYDSYLYLSAIRENYLPGLGFGRMYFIKLFSWLYFLLPTANVSLLTLLLKFCNFIFSFIAMGILARLFQKKYQCHFRWILFFSLLVATSASISFYSFEIVTEPLTLLLLSLCLGLLHLFDLSLIKRRALLFLLLGVMIHCRESYLLLLPYFFIEWKKLNKDSLRLPLAFFSIATLLPFAYQYLYRGNTYLLQISTAFSQTLQIEKDWPRLAIITGCAALLLIVIFLFKKIMCWNLKSNYFTWVFLLLPDLLHLVSGTLQPLEKPRYYDIATITLTLLATHFWVFSLYSPSPTLFQNTL